MRSMLRQLMLLMLLLLLCGCTLPQPGPTMRDNVLPVTGDQYVEVTTPMIFYDMTIRQGKANSDGERPEQHRSAIRILAGKYALEAQDEEYYYFRSPNGVEFALLEVEMFPQQNPVPREVRTIPGGLVFLRKNPLGTLAHAGIFIDSDREDQKMIAWRLGGEFLTRRKVDWNYTP